MINFVRIHYRRCFVICCLFFCFFVFLLNKKSPSIETKNEFIRDDNDEFINLIDLFRHSFQLVYQSGKLIQNIQNKNINYKQIFQKKSFDNLPSEPLTIADLLSHSILKNGLKQKFQHLQVQFVFKRLFI